jgi:acyl-CoA thioesterase-1
MSTRALVILSVLAVQFAPAWGTERTIVVLGDSLSSGYGLGAEQSWVGLLENHLAGQAYGYDVVNASIAGDTSAGGLARLPGLLATHAPSVVVIELGGNDGLRGLPVPRLKQNLARMIELTQAAGAEVVLTGIQIPPNYGQTYTETFARVYHELASEYEIALVAFLMEGVALDPSLLQDDRIHPNAAGQRPMFENVWNVLSELL